MAHCASGILLLLALTASALAPLTASAAPKPGKHRVMFNLDCTEYFVGSFGPVVPATIDSYVDKHASLGVTDFFINVNAQRVNYRSDVWETYWDGYDPGLGDDQVFFAGKADELQWIKAMYNLYRSGCDYPKRMIDRVRKNGMKAWLSVRMNDAHWPDEPDSPGHSTFWKSHPQWHLSNTGLDYGQKEVRDHHLKLIRELCSRYDLDGLELDYLRFWLYFRPGREHECEKLMTAFVREARSIAQDAAKRLGHPVELAVRVPSSPWIARRHGLDAVEWGKAGLVDVIIPSPWWTSLNSDIPVETWKGLLAGTGTIIASSLEAGIDSGVGGRRTVTTEELRGALTSGLERGADAVYFFNLFTGPHDLIKESGSYNDLCAGPRRHPVTVISPYALGEPNPERQLPHSGTRAVFRLHVGPQPLSGMKARVELVVPGNDQPLDVQVNDTSCPWETLAGKDYYASSGWTQPEPKRHIYSVPAGALDDGYNLVVVNSREPVTLNWVEISVR